MTADFQCRGGGEGSQQLFCFLRLILGRFEEIDEFIPSLFRIREALRFAEMFPKNERFIGRLDVGIVFWDLVTGRADRFEGVPTIVDLHHGVDQSRNFGDFGKFPEEGSQLRGGRFSKGAHNIVEPGVVRGGSGGGQPRFGLRGTPAIFRHTDHRGGGRTTMHPVMAMNVERTRQRFSGLDELGLHVRADAIVPVGKVNVTQAMFAGCCHVRFGSIDGDDGFDAETRQGFKTRFAFRGASRKEVHAQRKHVVNAGRFESSDSGREWFGWRNAIGGVYELSEKYRKRGEENQGAFSKMNRHANRVFRCKTLHWPDRFIISSVFDQLELSPLAKEVVVNAGELDSALGGGGLIGQIAGEALNGEIEVEHESAAAVVADHALNPKK